MPYRFTHDDMFGCFDRARELSARLINADVEEIALATNTTYGLSQAAQALPFDSGDVVLVSDREFPANVYPWMLARNKGVTLELVPVTPEGWPDEARLFDRLSDPRVRAISVSTVQFSNGYLIDIDRLSRETRRLGKWLIVDAIQALGHLPFDVRRTPVDLLACGGQKWLLSPWGSGFLYARRDLIPQLHPVMTGWMAFEGTDDLSRLTSYREAFRGDARRFEMVTLPFQDFYGMVRSLELLLSLGIEQIRRHLETLHQPVLEWARRRDVKVTSPSGAHGSAILCVAPERLVETHRALRAAGIHLSLREGALRLSPHCYNTVEEMERTAEVLERER
jgi:selenocysteine lyase/cysteine desulfurase